MDYKQISFLMKDFIDETINFYEHMDEHRVSASADPRIGERIKKQGIPKTGRPLSQICRQMQEEILPASSLGQHPRSFACIPGPISLLSWMGEMMTGAFNPHGGSAANVPGPAAVEQELIRWMCGLAGYPSSAGGLFVSGGSMANLTALTAARDSRLVFEERDKGVAYVSDQTHSSAAKAFHILGFQQWQIRRIPTDSSFAMDVKALEQAIRHDISQGLTPFAVVATAGTTNTGSIDPLPQIARLCKAFGLWMHVDGAFGASILLSDWGQRLLKGIEQSDSISWGRPQMAAPDLQLQRCTGQETGSSDPELFLPSGISGRYGGRPGPDKFLGFWTGADPALPWAEAVVHPSGSGTGSNGAGYGAQLPHGAGCGAGIKKGPPLGNHLPPQPGNPELPLCASRPVPG